MSTVSKIYGNIYAQKKKAKSPSKKQRTAKLAKTYAHELEDRATPSELKFKLFLDEHGFGYEFQKPFKHNGKFSIVDFYLPAYGAVVEIDGEYHESGQQKLKDKLRTRALMCVNQIRVVVRFTNDEVNSTQPQVLLKKLVLEIVPQAEILFDGE